MSSFLQMKQLRPRKVQCTQRHTTGQAERGLAPLSWTVLSSQQPSRLPRALKFQILLIMFLWGMCSEPLASGKKHSHLQTVLSRYFAPVWKNVIPYFRPESYSEYLTMRLLPASSTTSETPRKETQLLLFSVWEPKLGLWDGTGLVG